MDLARKRKIVYLVKQAEGTSSKNDIANVMKVLGVVGLSAAAGTGVGMLIRSQLKTLRATPARSRLGATLRGPGFSKFMVRAAPFVAGAGALAAIHKSKKLRSALGLRDNT